MKREHMEMLSFAVLPALKNFKFKVLPDEKFKLMVGFAVFLTKT